MSSLLREIRELREFMEDLEPRNPWMTLAQAEDYLGFKKDARHRAVKRFLRESGIKIKILNGNRPRVSRSQIDREMSKDLTHAV